MGNIVHDLDPKKKGKSPLLVVVVFTVIIGIATGFIATRLLSSESVASLTRGGDVETVEKGETIGSDDLETYSDEAEGVLREGGIEGEGAYHLERPGGESQNVYLSSTTVDLSQFVGKKVKVWGQTYAAKVAPWLMEVGRLQLLE